MLDKIIQERQAENEKAAVQFNPEKFPELAGVAYVKLVDVDTLTADTARAVAMKVLEEVRAEAESMQIKKGHPEYDMWSEIQGGYNTALTDILTHLTTLKEQITK